MRRAIALILLALAAPAAAAGDLAADMGRSLFDRKWSTSAADGLGPLYNERTCAACHKDGGPARFAAAPDGTLAIAGAVVRLADEHGRPDPFYGIQVQTHGTAGVEAEAAVDARLVPAAGGLARVDVTVKPFGPPLGEGVRAALRVAPSTRSAASIDRVDMAAVERLGVSKGRVRWFKDASGQAVAGRFGWRAGQTSLTDQVASAFMLDMGLSSPARPQPHGDCTAEQAACLAVPAPGKVEYGGYEVSPELVTLVADYVDSLDVTPDGPAPRNALFEAAGCAACHLPDAPVTGGGTVALFSDLMLHDMGEGLSDGMGEADVKPSEWRTPPLAAISKDASPTRRYLHDGRAASIEEAIRWHGGEAEPARKAFEAMSKSDRDALVAFVKSL
ncbi:MAG: di-heme oxidoredictase family protein [Hyphomicrobiales bacterium]